MMEPVAPADDRQIELMKDFWTYYGSPPYKREFDARLLKKDFLSLIVRLSDAEARIKELEGEVDEALAGNVVPSSVWMRQMELTRKAEARAEAAEALLKEARDKALEEAAKVADEITDELFGRSGELAAFRIASRVRALKEKP